MPLNIQAAKSAGWSQAEIDAYMTRKQASAPESSGQSWSTQGNDMTSLMMKAMGAVTPGLKQTVEGIFEKAPTHKMDAKDVAYSATGPLPQYALGLAEKMGVKGAKNLQSDMFQTIQPGAEELSKIYLTGKILAKIAPWLTKKGLANKTTSAASKGNDIPFNDIASGFKQTTGKKLGSTPEITKTMNTLLREKVPLTLNNETPFLGSSDVLDWRRQILNRGGKGFLQRLFTGESVPEKVEGLLRSELSSKLHQYAPATRVPDTLYSLYSKYGTPGQNVLRGAAGLSLYKLFPSILKSAIGTAAEK